MNHPPTPRDAALGKARALLDEAIGGMSLDDLQRAETGRWSPAQILEHLAKAYGSTAYIMRKAVADGAPKGRAPSWKQRLFAFAIVQGGYFPTGVKAPAITEPSGVAPEQALAMARDALLDLDQAADACLTRFGPQARVANHPLLGGFTVDQWRRFHWRHTAHHARQIRARRR